MTKPRPWDRKLLRNLTTILNASQDIEDGLRSHLPNLVKIEQANTRISRALKKLLPVE